jgi:hypothetical protein
MVEGIRAGVDRKGPNMISLQHRASDGFVLRRALLVPVCLCLVVAIHAYHVHANGQTAWKGGGFGMFSTVDAEHARYVKAYLLTPQGEFPVAIPADLRKSVAQLRAAPNQAATENLARKLLAKHWVDQQWLWSQRAEQVEKHHGERIAATHLHPTDENASIWSYRPQGSFSPLEPGNANNQPSAVNKVRVEVWRYRFQQQEQMLTTERLFVATPSKQQE